ncbi:Uncharacterised protein [Lederbergia lenta]|uniref:Uncharacterized protein n=1 Tax=Lederbergia lenta TaxID=1467 RepID=A0A2X4VGH8_LEDLE|nr:Uncharacterised protein [Lederbergia lenta]
MIYNKLTAIRTMMKSQGGSLLMNTKGKEI